MEDFLKWRESWLTGIEALDIQHAELATCLNSMDQETLEALKSWFIAHITHSDKLFAEFMSRQGVSNACTGDQQ